MANKNVTLQYNGDNLYPQTKVENITDLSSLDAADLSSGSATQGQVLTADGSGGCAWANASGGGGSSIVNTVNCYFYSDQNDEGGDRFIEVHFIDNSVLEITDTDSSYSMGHFTFTNVSYIEITYGPMYSTDNTVFHKETSTGSVTVVNDSRFNFNTSTTNNNILLDVCIKTIFLD